LEWCAGTAIERPVDRDVGAAVSRGLDELIAPAAAGWCPSDIPSLELDQPKPGTTPDSSAPRRRCRARAGDDTNIDQLDTAAVTSA
jgi:hypothetical protein